MRFVNHWTLALLAVAVPLSAAEPDAPHPATPEVPRAASRNVSKRAEQIAIKVQVFEVSHTRMKKLGFSVKKFEPLRVSDSQPEEGAPAEAFTFQTIDAQGAVGLLKALQREDLAKVLAEPTLVTVSGRPASYFVGGEVPTPGHPGDEQAAPRYRRHGTEINYVPILLDEHRLSLEIRVRVSQLEPSLDRVVGEQRFPGIRTVEVDTGLEMELGKTTVIGGMRQRRALPAGEEAQASHEVEHEQIETVFFVTPERVTALPPHGESRDAVTR